MLTAITPPGTVILQMVQHRGSNWILIGGKDAMRYSSAIRKVSGRKYSATRRSWLMPPNRQSYNELTLVLRDKAIIDISALKAGATTSKENVVTTGLLNKVIDKRSFTPGIIEGTNSYVLPKMLQYLQLKAYSGSTIRTYINEMSQFLKTIKGHDAAGFNTQRLKDYLQYCHQKLELSENTIHSRMNALKLYYEQVLKREKLFWEIPRPKKRMILPKLLNETEISKLFNALTNKKHKAILFTTYSAGLRVSEIVSLKIADIDSVRMQIFVEQAKGKKDRYVNLSPVVLDILRKYITDYLPRPKVYLFESEQTLTA